MIGKILWILILLVFLVFAGWFLYENLPGEPQEFIVSNLGGGDTGENLIEYSSIQQFYPNMRFNHRVISYHIESDCGEEKGARIDFAFSEISKASGGVLTFFSSDSNSDIIASCDEKLMETQKNYFIAGEGGPTEIVNTSLYNVILKGKIFLYRKSECSYPNIEVHEILHVFGFDHSDNPRSIMHNYSACNQAITEDIKEALIILYSEEAAADLFVSSVDAVKKGRYLDFNIEVRNRGMKDVGNASLSVFSDEKEVGVFSLDQLDFGAGKVLSVENAKLPSRSSTNVRFVIDIENNINELYEDNNAVELSLN